MAPRYARMDFVHPDAAPAQELNAIIWKTVRGADARMPADRAACAFYRNTDPD